MSKPSTTISFRMNPYPDTESGRDVTEVESEELEDWFQKIEETEELQEFEIVGDSIQIPLDVARKYTGEQLLAVLEFWRAFGKMYIMSAIQDELSEYVYLAEIESGQHKIGMSKDPDKRVTHFDTKMPLSVDVVHTFPCDNAREAESKLHDMYEENRINGEWFDLTDQEVGNIKNIDMHLAGNFYLENWKLNCAGSLEEHGFKCDVASEVSPR